MPSLRPLSNKVCVPNAYFMLPLVTSEQPLKPGKGELRTGSRGSFVIWYTLGFHHLHNLSVSSFDRGQFDSHVQNLEG